VLPSHTYPAVATAESSHGLSVPSAHEEFEVHCPRAKPARYVPPSGFGYPLGGLRPRIPCRFCFTPAALVGFHLRRFPLLTGVCSLSAETNLHTVGSTVSPPLARQTGPTSLGFQVHTCQDCLVTARRFRPTATGASLGLCPSRVCRQRPCPGLPQELLPRAWLARAITRRTNVHLGVSVNLRLAPPYQHRSAARPTQPLWGFCTCPIPTI